MSLPGRHKPLHRRIEIIRSFKMTRLMLEQIRAACDENDISFSHFLREAITQSLSRYNRQITTPHRQTKQCNTSLRMR
jgi:DNA-binding transcriptional MerR regulator